MKRYIPIIILLLLVSSGMSAQTFSDDNFVYTAVPKKAVQSGNFTTLTKDDVNQNITYFDGLGRPVQTIAIGQGGTGSDIITPIQYDAFGRQSKEYLPYAAANGGSNYSKIDPLAATNAVIAFYSSDKYQNTANPFSEKSLEASPLNRVLKQAAPGNSWVMGGGHEIKLDYQTNTASEVKLYKTTATWNPGSGLYDIVFSDAGNYAVNQLYKNITYDENTTAAPLESAGSTVEFKNKEGQVVLKRTYDAGVKHDTYYVYDIYGNLTYVIPPKADGTIADEVLNGLCYQYKYDNRNRLVEKKLPGKQWEFIVYDKLDRPVATGPAASPFKDDTAVGWIITKYDAFGRPIYTGWMNQASNSSVRKTLQDNQNSSTGLFETKEAARTIDGISAYYTNSVTPLVFKLLTVNYYDDYTFPDIPAVPTTVIGQPVLANTKGLVTGSWTRVLTLASAALGETTTTFYDEKARPIRTYKKNHLGGYLQIDNQLDFTGKNLTTQTEQQRLLNGAITTIEEKFTYSAQDRLLTHTHQINKGTIQLMADNTYDALGQLESKKVGNTTGSPLQKVDFSYNIRGWLTEINKTSNLQKDSDPVDLFAFKINYNTTQAGISGVNALYNGNIAETTWKTGSDVIERGYGYKYDNLNRLKNAIYEKNGITTDMYDEGLTYDKNGNIMTLARKGDLDAQIGAIDIDNLAYTYPANSNQLFKIDDSSNNTSGFNDLNKSGDDYSYDVNGNLFTDKNKNITAITYNHLNLPKKITFGTAGSIEYIYNAAGQKVEKNVIVGVTPAVNTNYLDGFQYKDNVLEFFPTAEGYVKNTSGTLSYVFQYKDHLGNVRVSYTKNAQNVLQIIDENNYYPFGLKHNGYNDYAATNNKYKYNGKELQDELGLNVYDFGARNYDPAIGRWVVHDPLSDASFQPYSFANNNPISFNDPTGMIAEGGEAFASTDVVRNKNGSFTVVGAYDDGDTNIYVVNNSTEKKRTGEVIGETVRPCDFCTTNDVTGGYKPFDKNISGVTFNLNNLNISGTAKDKSGRSAELESLDANGLLEWIKKYYMNVINNDMPGTPYGWLEELKELSANGSILDVKVSLGLPSYTAISIGKNSRLKPIITTLRAIGNIGFGANMLQAKPPIVGMNFWYGAIMNKAGQYNQSQNGGNGYNRYFPYFGEHSYSGGYIYYGYYNQFYKR